MTNQPLPITAQAHQYVLRFGAKGARAYVRRLSELRVKTSEQRALTAALWREINQAN